MTMEREHVERLSRDLREAAHTLSDAEVRFLVDAYYLIQEDRKRSANQVRSMGEEPHRLLDWFARQNRILETQLQTALDRYSSSKKVGRWMKSNYGIGPVITAGLMAHIDIKKAPTAGHIWSFAGLTDETAWLGGKKAEEAVKAFINERKMATVDDIISVATKVGCSPKWLARRAVRAATKLDIPFRGLEQTDNRLYVTSLLTDKKIRMKHVIEALARRPWNASLKTLAWKTGQCFMKFSNAEECFYGKVYRERKEFEANRNDTGGNSELAARLLPKFKKTTDAYEHLKGGKLPPAQIDARARRWAVKLFLAHLQQVWWEIDTGRPPVKPYVVEHLGHVDMIHPPNWPMNSE